MRGKNKFPIYSRLLRLYPEDYRKKYESEMLLTTADMLDDAPNTWSKWVVWCTVAIDLPKSVAKQQIKHVTNEGVRMMPPYVKRNSIIAAILLVPFFAALVANAMEKVLFDHTLYGSWLWHRPFIGLWVLYFPMIAVLLSGISYVFYVVRGGYEDRRSAWTRIVNLARSWPLLLTGVAACGILFVLVFHDSGQCWVHAPSYAVSHFSQSWQCTENNRVDIGKVLGHSL